MTTKSTEAPARRTAWAWMVATFFGVGLVGKGGGTLTSAIIAGLYLVAAGNARPATLLAVTGTFAVIATTMGVVSAAIVARETGQKDPTIVVIDEVAGQLIALTAAGANWKYVLAAFILFRALDITKPPPVRQLERLPGGWGIMLDDVAAGVIAAMVLLALRSLQLL